MGPLPRGLTTCRRETHGLVQCGSGSRSRQESGLFDPRLWRLSLGTSYVTVLAGKQLEIVGEVEHYKLDIVRLTSTQCRLWNPFERGWTLLCLSCTQGEAEGRCGLPNSQPLCWGFLQWTKELLPCTFGGTERGTGPDCRMRICAKQQFRAPTLFRVLGMDAR